MEKKFREVKSRLDNIKLKLSEILVAVNHRIRSIRKSERTRNSTFNTWQKL